MPVAIFLGCCMSQHEDSSSVTTSIKMLKDINSIKPSYVEVCEYLCNRISSNVCSSIHRNLKLASCMTYSIAVCTVKISWWWTEELSETCRVLFQNKFEKLVHLFFFIIRNLKKKVRWRKLLAKLDDKEKCNFFKKLREQNCTIDII